MKFLIRLLLRFALTTIVVWALATWLDQYVSVTGGWLAYAVIGALISIMNIVVEPVLRIVVAPLKLVANILAIVALNAVFLWLTVTVIGALDTSAVTLQIEGGIVGWIVAALAFGFAKWLLRIVIR